MSDFNPLDAYSRGFVGCRPSPRSDEEFADLILRRGGDPDGGNVAHSWDFADGGKGKLIMLWPAVERIFPNCWPGPTQLTGDCVSKGSANALLTSMALEIADGEPDPVSGHVEEAPELPKAGIENGVVASESLWAWRGYSGDGWICSEAAKVATTKGFLVRKPYPELKIDLTEYTEDTLRLGGARAPGEKWLAESSKHIARTATFVEGREQVRDMLFAGYGVFNCSSMAFERTRNEDGYSRQVGTWQHSQCYIGYDDRPETHQKYGQALVAWLNSWAIWNSGPRAVREMPGYELPEGAFWTLASTIDRARNIALSSVAGWPKRKHTTYGATGNV